MAIVTSPNRIKTTLMIKMLGTITLVKEIKEKVEWDVVLVLFN